MQCCDGDKLGPEKSLNGLGSKWEGLKVVVATANRIHLVTQLLEGLMCFYETKIKIIPLIWTKNAKITDTHTRGTLCSIASFSTLLLLSV